MNVELPDGRVITDVPDGTTREQLSERLKRNGMPVPDAWMGGDVGTAFKKGEAHAMIPDAVPPRAPSRDEKEPGMVDSLLAGGLEAGASMASSIPAGAAGNIAGFVRALASGKFGTPEAVQEGAETGKQVSEALTIEPRSKYGKKALRTVGEIIDASKIQGLNPATPIGAYMPGQGAAARRAGAGAARRVGDAAVDVAEGEGLRAPEGAAMAGVGSAETDVARMRRERAADLPVPLSLTKGQAERSFEQQRFEREAAKSEKLGKPIRERFAEQNEQILQNFDAWVDQTGAQAPTLRATGQSVNEALVSKANRAKAQINEAYEKARAAGELAKPVGTRELVAYIEENRPAAINAPVLTTIEQKLVQLGGAAKGDGGALQAGRISINDMEELRKLIGEVSGATPTNVRFGTKAKEIIDATTEGAGGTLYKEARRLRSDYARHFEDRAVVAKLLDTKPGTRDRAVAFEDVFAHSMLNSSLDDVRHLRRVLQNEGPKGNQAWKELQGQTVSYIRGEATKGVASDIRGNAIISPAALAKTVKALDADGKLDFIFGKQGAQQVRDITDLAKDVYTAPPGAVNQSVTASVLLDALAGVADVTGVSGGSATATAKALGWVREHLKGRKVKARVRDALEDPLTRDRPIRELQGVE